MLRKGSLQGEIARAAESGFNTVVVDAFSGGFTTYRSAAARAAGLGQHPALRRRDALAKTCALARRHSMGVYASIATFQNGSVEQEPRSPFLGRHSDWLLRGRARRWFTPRWRPIAQSPEQTAGRSAVWLCPGNPEVHRFFGMMGAEIASGYPVDGLLLEGLHYPPTELGHNYCGCRSCTARVAADLSIDLKKEWPEPGSEAHARWTHWRAQRLTEFLEVVKARSRKGRRTIRVAGVVPRHPPEDRPDPTLLSVGEWVQDSLLDVFCWGPDLIPSGTPDLHWRQVVLPAGGPAESWPELARTPGEGLLVRWSERPREEDWGEAAIRIGPRVPALESAPLAHARLLLSRAAELGLEPCREVSELTRIIAEQYPLEEYSGARIERLITLADQVAQLKSSSTAAVQEQPLPAESDLQTAAACLNAAAGLVRLALMTA